MTSVSFLCESVVYMSTMRACHAVRLSNVWFMCSFNTLHNVQIYSIGMAWIVRFVCVSVNCKMERNVLGANLGKLDSSTGFYRNTFRFYDKYTMEKISMFGPLPSI